ncbi:MAG: hypothetical protein ACE5J3_03185 [Methanosarcinales archaeon]
MEFQYDFVRSKAAWALRRIKDPSTVHALIKALRDEYYRV